MTCSLKGPRGPTARLATRTMIPVAASLSRRRWSAYGALAKCAAKHVQPFWERGALLLAMRAEFRRCAIRGTMRTVNDQLGYWRVTRLLEAGLARDTPRIFHLGERVF